MKLLLTSMIALVLLGPAGNASAQQIEKDYIRCRLDPQCPKPGFRTLPFDKRGVTISGEAAEPPNSINFHVTFAYDSADLQNDSLITLDALGAALSDPSLKQFTFMIAGHTDARGSEDYNQKLSERRAASVARYLAERFKIETGKLVIKGYGKQQLYDPARPEDLVNRRVQIVNITANGN